MSVLMLTVRDRNGDFVVIPDPDTTPRTHVAHHPRCDGTGVTRANDPADALPVACPACRPVASAAHARSMRLGAIGAPRRRHGRT